MARLTLAKSDVGRRTLDALTGRLPVACSLRPSSLTRSSTHASASASHVARRATFCASSSGMKASMTRFFSAICTGKCVGRLSSVSRQHAPQRRACRGKLQRVRRLRRRAWWVSMRMESSMSSRSRCSSALRSSTSCCTSLYRPHSFFSFLPLASASCCRLLYVPSLASCASSSFASFSCASRAFACLAHPIPHQQRQPLPPHTYKAQLVNTHGGGGSSTHLSSSSRRFFSISSAVSCTTSCSPPVLDSPCSNPGLHRCHCQFRHPCRPVL